MIEEKPDKSRDSGPCVPPPAMKKAEENRSGYLRFARLVDKHIKL
jgi:hypothetical protein